MAPVKRVLFFTYSEHGQAQIHLSTAYELLSQPDVEVHIASFEELAPRTVQISQLFNQQHESSPKKEIKYHLIDYPSMKKLTTSMQSLHHHGFFGALRSFRNMTRVLLCWKPAQYIGIVQRCSEIVDVVQPDVVVADSLFAQATDMCRQKLARKDGLLREERAKYVILNPLDFSHTFADAQPGFAGWVKIPMWVVPNSLLLAISTPCFTSPYLRDAMFCMQFWLRLPIPTPLVSDSPQHHSPYSSDHRLRLLPGSARPDPSP